MRSFALLVFGILMLIMSSLMLMAASQPGVRLGIMLDGDWIELGALVRTLAVAQLVFWAYVIVISAVYCFCSQSLPESWRHKTEGAMGRAADAIKDMILDLGPAGENPQDADKPEFGTDPLPSLAPREFILSMRGKMEQTLARVAEAINTAQTGQEIAAHEEDVKLLLGELRFDAIAVGLQLRNDAAEAGLAPAGATAAFAALQPPGTKSGKAKSYPASDDWRPVWVERYRSMRAEETAFRLAQRSRRRSTLDN